MDISIQTLLLILMCFIAYTQWITKRFKTRLKKLEDFLYPIMKHSVEAEKLKKRIDEKISDSKKTN